MRILLFATAFFIHSFLIAQPFFPENGKVFNDQLVPRIDINIDQASLNQILDPANSQSFQEFSATFMFDDGTNKDTVYNVGFRLRGNTSRQSQKKSFKVSFNTFTPGRKYEGLEKLNLNGEHNDPSIIRAKLSWDLMREIGVPAPRSNHVEFYINDQYRGLYINVEHIDEEFAGSRFGSKKGNLYKCLWPATLEYLGSNSNLYKAQSGNRRIYDLKTNTGIDDYSGLAHFIDVLNNTPVNNLACELEQVFNVESYLKAMAIDVIIGNWDGPIFNKNNFYLYENPQTGKIEYIPYDLDNTFGIDWFGEDWGTRNIYTWSKSNEPRPIYTQLLSVPEYKDQYTFHLTNILNGFMSNPGYENYIDGIKSMIDPFVPGDQFRTLDYGYTVTDFDNSYNNALSGHVKYGIKPYATTRKNSAITQAIINDIKPIIFQPIYSTPKLNQPTTFSVFVEDESISSVDFHYQFDGGSWQQLSMADDGNGSDLQAGDHVFTVSVPGFNHGGLLAWYVEATDQNSQTSREPRCVDYELNIAAPAPPLVINELMADNAAYQADEEGEFDDWIEILNVGNEPIPLGDKYLSDDFEEPNKWGMPNITIHPGQYILFWADADGHQGSRHANFKLKKAGETVGIFNSQANGFSVIDTVTFPALNTDESYGRIPNGTGEFQVLTTATHGSNNEGTSINDPNFSEINIYPNPFSEQIEIAIKPDKYRFLNIEFVDVSGKIVHSEILYSEPTQIHYRINPQNLAKGVYFMIIKDRANDFVVLQTLKMVKI